MATSQRPGSGPGESFQHTLVTGGFIGAGAYVVNYVLMYLFIILDGVWEQTVTWEFVGLVLYNAQFVSTEINYPSTSLRANYITGSVSSPMLEGWISAFAIGDTVPTFVYHLAPILVLVAGGFIVARQTQAVDTATSAATGATITAGTVVLSIVGVLLFEIESDGYTAGPELLMGVLLVGIVIPAVAGAIGGAIADQV